MTKTIIAAAFLFAAVGTGVASAQTATQTILAFNHPFTVPVYGAPAAPVVNALAAPAPLRTKVVHVRAHATSREQ